MELTIRNKNYSALSCFLSLFLFLFCGQAQAQKPDQLARVGVSKVQALPEMNKIELPGNVLPWATSRLAAEVEGHVEKIMVEEGQPVCVLEAMKMENELHARQGGTVRAVHAKPGDDVEKDQVLVEIE